MWLIGVTWASAILFSVCVPSLLSETACRPAAALTPSCRLRLQRSFPYISAMVNNGTVKYDHGKDGRSSELGGCSAEIRNRDHDTYLAIRYSKERLTVGGDAVLQSPSDAAKTRTGVLIFPSVCCRWWLTWTTRTSGRSASTSEAFVFPLDISLGPRQPQEICLVGFLVRCVS